MRRRRRHMRLAGKFEKALVEIGASFVAGAEPFELVQPGEGTLDDPAHLAQSGAVSDAASGDHRLDAAFPQQAAVLVEVVAPVGIQAPGLAAGTPPQTPNRRNGVEQGQELGDVVPVATGERDGERGSVTVDDRWCFEPERARSTGEGPWSPLSAPGRAIRPRSSRPGPAGWRDEARSTGRRAGAARRRPRSSPAVGARPSHLNSPLPPRGRHATRHRSAVRT